MKVKLLIKDKDGKQIDNMVWDSAELAEQYYDKHVPKVKGQTYEIRPNEEPPVEIVQLTDREIESTKALAYLRDTDWYVTRLAETGTPIPEDVLAARAEARDKVIPKETI